MHQDGELFEVSGEQSWSLEGESCSHESHGGVCRGGYLQSVFPQPRAAAGYGGIGEISGNIDHHSHLRHPVLNGGDADGIGGVAVEIIGGSVQRIHYP